jgi:beta-lactamase class A
MLIAAACAIAGLLHSCSQPAARATLVTHQTLGNARAAESGRRIDVAGVQERLLGDISGLQGSYGIAVIDLSSGTVYGVNGNRLFRAASVNKMPIILTLYDRAAAGKVSLDQTLTISDADIQHYGTGTIQNSDARRVYSLRQLGDLMIQVSDNTAAFVLERYLGQQAVQQNASRWHMDHTSMADNTTTPADAVSLMANLSAGRLLPPDATQTILRLLKSTVFTDRLGSGLPTGVPLAHKVGTDVGVYNDSGIVMLPQRPYAIAVFSEDADEAEANAAFAKVSSDAYDFEVSLGAAPNR